MAGYQIDRKLDELDKAMRKLRVAMKAPVMRTAGFKKVHDNVAKSIATATTTVEAAKPLFNTDASKPQARR